jgi:hypothetical protein
MMTGSIGVAVIGAGMADRLQNMWVEEAIVERARRLAPR